MADLSTSTYADRLETGRAIAAIYRTASRANRFDELVRENDRYAEGFEDGLMAVAVVMGIDDDLEEAIGKEKQRLWWKKRLAEDDDSPERHCAA